MKNLGEYERSVDVKIIIENNQRVFLREVAALSDLTFKEGEEKNLKDLVFKTGTDYSGSHRVRLIVYENLKPVGEASTDFTIEAVLATSPETPFIDGMDVHVP